MLSRIYLGQLVKRALEATAARRRDGEKTSIETLADGFGQPACAVAHTIDRADDGVAACDHFLDTVQAILDAAVVVEKGAATRAAATVRRWRTMAVRPPR